MTAPLRSALAVLLAAAAPAALAQGPAGPSAAAPPPPSPGTPAAPAAPAAPEAATMLRLADGGILWGAIAEHDEEALAFRRLDTGGLVRLPWALVDPAQAEELRTRYGYVDAGVEEVLVSADRVPLVDGTEIVGRITERTSTHLWVKNARGLFPVPLQRIAGGSTIARVPALDVYTEDELYQRRVLELQDRLSAGGADAAAAHVELARFSEQLFDYERAVVHYEAAVAADPDHEAETVPNLLARAREKAALQAQLDHLREIDLWRARGRYGRAVEMIASFPELYPDSPLVDEWNRVRERVARYQERALRDEVAGSWHRWTRRLAERAARELGYQQALAYLEGRMADELLTAVTEEMREIAPEIRPDEVRALFDERKGGRFRQASYGHGTWLLGEDAALAGLEEDEEEAPAAEGSQEEARRRIDEKIKRYLQNQEAARRGSSQRDEEEPEAFWEDWPTPNKTQWVLAYYAEHSGDFHVEAFRFRNCRECGGTGARRIVFTGGAVSGATSGERVVPCPTCHGLGVVRMVRYR